ncbi:MAG: TPM domain-containing protein [Pyrinomonadaceae bacterium]|nr:TPM domain-containing protein [Pyrinomonadaceae bacterium]
MKLRQTFATVSLVLMACFVAFAQSEQFSVNQSPLPEPTGMVNDYANIIDDTVQAQIEQKLRDFKTKTNPQVEIAVVTVKTTGERPIFDYSLAVARGWKIGSKEDDNPSALLLIAVDDRKYFTQISKDLEDELPDGIVGNLQRQYLVPAFKQGNYTKGINDTVDAYIKTISERKSDPTGTPKPSTTSERGGGGLIICCIVIIIFVVILIIVLSSIGKGGGSGGGGSRGDRDRWRSGGFGGNTSNSGYSSPIVIWGGGGGGSSSSWGGSSGGGDSWGGFGGGGDFGGGGAGGDW